MRQAAGLLFILPIMAGCVVMNQQAAEEGKTALIGKTRGEILACAGVPNGTYRDGGTEYFSYAATGRYRSGGSTQYLGNGIFVSSGGGRQAACIVTMSLQNGRVSNVSYRSSGGGLIAPDEACGTVVAACMR